MSMREDVLAELAEAGDHGLELEELITLINPYHDYDLTQDEVIELLDDLIEEGVVYFDGYVYTIPE